MTGWQLESFKESYENKKKNGISLYKKKLNEQKQFNINNLYNWHNFWSFFP